VQGIQFTPERFSQELFNLVDVFVPILTHKCNRCITDVANQFLILELKINQVQLNLCLTTRTLFCYKPQQLHHSRLIHILQRIEFGVPHHLPLALKQRLLLFRQPLH